MAVLITGSNGFLGAALVRRLLERGTRDVRCLVRPGSRHKQVEELVKKHPQLGAQIVVGSLASERDARALLDGVDLIHHVAATVSGAPAEMVLGTVVATRHLLDAALSMPKVPKVVLVSSFGVYGTANLAKGAVVDEATPTEPDPRSRDTYSYTKLKQEELALDYARNKHLPLVIMRPGVIYGPQGGLMSGRVGIRLPGLFLYLGGDNVLPLSYVDNCAEALSVAADKAKFDGDIYNVHDDDLITCRAFLRRYRREVEPLRVVKLPLPATLALSHAVAWYHRFSKGQLPALFTPYKTKTTWKGTRFSNAKLKELGFRQPVSTEEGLRRTFEALRERVRNAA